MPEVLTDSGYGPITTEILPAEPRAFYPAEAYHQQYLARNPTGYCGIGGAGVIAAALLIVVLILRRQVREFRSGLVTFIPGLSLG